MKVWRSRRVTGSLGSPEGIRTDLEYEAECECVRECAEEIKVKD